MKTLLIFSCAFLLVGMVKAEEDPTLERRLASITSKWNRVSVETLLAAENKELLDEMRQRLRAKSDFEFAHSVYLGPLIKIGDDETLQRFLVQERHRRSTNVLWQAEQPKVITLIGEDLNRRENLKGVREGEDSLVLPPSVYAAGLIRLLIRRCPVFSQELKTWAESLPPPYLLHKHPEKMEAMRLWWKENKDLFRAGQYELVKPPGQRPIRDVNAP